jgi:hypothetical protein
MLGVHSFYELKCPLLTVGERTLVTFKAKGNSFFFGNFGAFFANFDKKRRVFIPPFL